MTMTHMENVMSFSSVLSRSSSTLDLAAASMRCLYTCLKNDNEYLRKRQAKVVDWR